ncbi:unnamed protein product [Closterium sp. NIES-53]
MVVDRLLHEESRRRQFANESEGAAMFSGGSSGKKSTWSKGATKKSSGGSDRSKGNTSNGSRKYHYCGKAGHFWRECRKRPSDWTPSKARNHEGNAHTASGDADDSRESIVLLAGDKTNTPSDAWFLDTGATQCMTHPASFLTNVGAPGDVTRLVFGNDKSLPVVGVGSTRLIVDGGLVDITNVLHVPGLKVNLLSVTQLAKKGVKVAIDDAKMNLFWKGRQFTQGVLNGELYQLKTHQKVASSNVAQGSKATLKAWHNRLAHANYELVKELAKKGLAKGFDVIAGDDEKGVCAACVKGKMARKPFGSHVTKAIQEWALEVCEDDKKRIKGICTDGGGEFVNAEFEKWMKSKGIKHDVTTPYTPQQNGAAEWLNHTLVEAVRSLLQHSKLGTSRAACPPARRALLQPARRALLLRASRLLQPTRRALLPCVFLGFPTDAPSWQFYHPRLRRVFSSQDVTFDESICYYRLHPHASHPVPLEPLFLVPVPPPLHPLPPQGLAPSGVSQVDPPPLVEPLEISSDSSGSAEGGDPAAHDTAATRRSPRFETPPGFSPRLSSPPLQPGAVDSGAETAGVEPGGAETEGEGSRGAATGGAGFGGAATGGVGSWGAATGGADFGGPASPSGVLLRGGGGYGPAGVGAVSLGGSAGAGGTGGTAGGAARAGGTRGAAGAGGAGVTSPRGATGAGGAGPISPRGTARARGAGGAAGSRGTGAGGTGGAGAAGPGGAHTRGAGATEAGGNTGARGPSAARASGAAGAGGARGATGAAGAGGAGAAGAGGAGAADQSQPQLRLGYPLPVPAPHTEVTESLSERREPETRASTPVRARRVAHPRPPTVPGTHSMALCPSSVPKRVVLPEPPASSLPHFPDPESDLARASLVTESESVCPPSVGGEPALGSDVLEDRQFELECLAAALPRFASMLLCPEGDPDALDIPPPRALSLRRSRVSTFLSGRQPWTHRWLPGGPQAPTVKRPPGSPPAFKARSVARGFSQQQGVDFFQTFFPTPKMTTLWVLLHVAAQRDYKLHSLDFSTAYLQGSLHEEIRLRRLPEFTGSFPVGTQWSLQRPIYALRQAPREWHDTLRTTLAALGFAPSFAEPSLFLRTDTTMPPFYVLVYVLQRFGFQFSSPQPTPLSTGHSLSAPPSDESIEPSGPYPELVGCLMYLMTCTRPDLAYPLSLLARYEAPVHRAWGSCLEDGVQCCEAEIYSGAMAAQELRWLTYLLTDLGERPRFPPVLYVDNKAMLALCHEQRLEHRTKHIALCYFLARELQQRRQLRLSYVASRANTADVFTKALGSSDHQRFCIALGLVPTLPNMLVA